MLSNSTFHERYVGSSWFLLANEPVDALGDIHVVMRLFCWNINALVRACGSRRQARLDIGLSKIVF